MKPHPFFLKIAILLFFVSVLPSFKGKSSKGNPKIVFDTTGYDFGRIYMKDGTVQHCFVFRNEGDADLIINDVTSSCGCSFAYWTRKPVSPGDTGSVCVNYKNNISGFFSKKLKIHSNAKSGKVELTVKGKTVLK